VRVSFYISAGGSISGVKVVRSSGIAELDELGKNAVFRLGSFQPPPSGKGETITVILKVE
jgi:periplasmic protein TonB